jgi:hypothetical protein
VVFDLFLTLWVSGSVMPHTSYGAALASLRAPERAVKVFLDPAAVPGAEVPV